MSGSKKFLIVISIVTAFLCSFYYIASYSVNKAEKEIISAITPIINDLSASNWSDDKFYLYASPELKEWFNQNGYDSLNVFKILGPMLSLNEIVSFDHNPKRSESLSLASFANNNNVYLNIILSKHEEKWLIDSFFAELGE